MMGYDVFYNSAYINSADNTSVNPIGLNTTGGFVGVGTIQPSYTLDVSGTTNISGNLFVTNDVSFNSALNVGNLNVGKNILVSGNVGIGTNNPLYKLDVSGNVNLKGNLIVTNDVSFNSALNVGNLNVGRNVIVSGNVGIGTNNPLTLLSTGSLVNNIKISVFDNGSGTNLYGLGYNPSGYMTFCSGQIQSGIPQMVLTNGGSLGIGTTAPEYTLDISGTVRSTQQITALSFNSTSDYRFKTNIHNIYRTVDHLKPIEYDFIGGSHDMGFLAHEVQKIFPFLVSGKKDGKEKQSINYNGFIALLVKEVQDLKYENNSLKERMDILEARLS